MSAHSFTEAESEYRSAARRYALAIRKLLLLSHSNSGHSLSALRADLVRAETAAGVTS